jgi:hypothetical protein
MIAFGLNLPIPEAIAVLHLLIIIMLFRILRRMR